MDIAQEHHGAVVVVAPTGRIDTTTSDRFEASLVAATTGDRPRLVLDLAGVDYISSAGLRVLLATAKRLGGGKGALALCALRDPVRNVLDLAGFLPLFAVDATRESALARLAG